MGKGPLRHDCRLGISDLFLTTNVGDGHWLGKAALEPPHSLSESSLLGAANPPCLSTVSHIELLLRCRSFVSAEMEIATWYVIQTIRGI